MCNNNNSNSDNSVVGLIHQYHSQATKLPGIRPSQKILLQVKDQVFLKLFLYFDYTVYFISYSSVTNFIHLLQVSCRCAYYISECCIV